MLFNSFSPRPIAALVASVLAVGFQSNQLMAAETNSTNKYNPDEKIVITGSRIKRTEVEGAATVVSMSAEEMQEQGFTTLFEALGSFTSATGSFVGEQFASGFQANAQALNFRGLGAGRTLYLLDGRRIADYPSPYNGESNFVNLAHIPLAMIERVEVMAGGASAIYGSDAMAGVVNIITKKNLASQTLTARIGETVEGGADSKRVQWFGGVEKKNFKNLWAIEAYDSEPLLGSDRPSIGSNESSPSLGIASAFFSDGLPFYNIDQDTCDDFGYTQETYDVRGNEGAFCVSNIDQYKTLKNDRTRYNLFDRISFEQGDYDELYLELHLWTSEAKSNSGPLFWSTTRPVQVNDANGQPAFIFDYFRTFTQDEFNDNSAKHKESGVDIQIGYSGFNDNFQDYKIVFSHSFQDSTETRKLLKERDTNEFFIGDFQTTQFNSDLIDISTLVDVFQVNDNSDFDRLFRQLSASEINNLIGEDESDRYSSISTLSFTYSGDLFSMKHGAAQFATVIEASRKDYEIELHPRTLNQSGNGWFGYTDTEGKGTRNSYGLGIETRWPLLKNLHLTAAGRLDKYDDKTAVDDAWTYNLGLEYRPVEGLLFRATANSSFRAPDMHLVYAGSGGAFYGSDTFAVTEGSLELEEETGNSQTLGVVYEPTDNLSLSVDLYQIELEGLVEFESAFSLRNNFINCVSDDAFEENNPDLCAFANERVTFDGTQFTVVTKPINTAYRLQQGIDSSFKYSLDTNLGRFAFTANHTNVLKSERQVFKSDDINTNWRNDRANSDLRSRFRSSATWEKNDWRVTLMSNRLGTVNSFNGGERLDSWTTYNLSTSYYFNLNFSVDLIVNNLTDEYPRIESGRSWPYFNTNHYNAMRRGWFIEGRYEF
ncbi:TonB-dependent receptor plug domain-containing protein [Pleionea mediterranea]|uniref:TonB-dependent receptor-like protein n=1 Tax=Pleionea mediterranea TaxID=523701 RepID=A0A316FWB7_9GAMM|nr:TonB-dependent receptor [Pleionea mediterranea]PWK46347.1 TonB-dependent receptor-like protein [Pleionea mediterranea]